MLIEPSQTILDLQNVDLIRRFYSPYNLQARPAYGYDLDTVVLGILANLRKETITYSYMGSNYGKVFTGKVIAVHGRTVHLWEGYNKRKFNIKNLIVYHPAIYSALALTTGMTPQTPDSSAF